ncbi:iron-containing redox enzyme family protein [Pseudanabaena sp. FACHB-2040]|uniref:iron-containing redox enzyme family protein n=1 Tax=Pseudanabaena sp. FACHB-2040 TaxID=2692859 RepID=UPI001684AFBC|nr:iron-containing redox enzyme family protein [Pseudanabaena sp. FACHB-2040]MBD2256195.1 iron-containing redox enzyme family protein [Pseudanabaena sp. FACHB-2040]
MTTVSVSPNILLKGIEQELPIVPQISDFSESEKRLTELLATADLDQQVTQRPDLVKDFEGAIAAALEAAYASISEPHDDDAHLFLQRVLYRINRLNLFWYDDLQHYRNERSFYLQWVRDRIESAWQAWELDQLDVEQFKQADIKQILTEWGDADLDPPVSENKRFLREEMDLEGYRRLLAIASLDGLVEASRMSRILGGASNEVQATLIRVLLEEYGNGRLSRKHSTFFAKMMAELDLNTQPEGYFELAPWQLLASINHNFLLTECKRHFLRYNGGLTYFEIAGPSIYTDYLIAAQRLGLSNDASGYWELHIREDERHGQWMLRDVALPLADHYPENAWEIVLGYAQEKYIGDRAGDAIIQRIKQAQSPLPRVQSQPSF